MAALRVLFVVALVGFFGPALTQDAVSGAGAPLVREPRGHKKRLCKKYGICGQQGIGVHQGYQQGHQGYQQGHQQGYQQGYPPVINIGISQSQSSASAGGGGYSHGYYPNNYQYNNHGHQPGYGGYHGGFGGFGGHQGFGRPGFSNGQGGFNNQFNGNYYGPGAGNGFGFPGQGGYYDEAHYEGSHDEGLSQHEQNDQAIFGDDHGRPDGPHEHGQYGHDYSISGSYAFAGRKNN